MKKVKVLAACLGALATTGCISSRGGQDVQCDNFAEFAKAPPANQFVADIQRYVPGRSPVKSDGAALEGETSEQGDSIGTAIADLFVSDSRGFRSEQGNILLLSGGGQWGAYGAGLFLGLACKDKAPSSPCMNTEGRLHSLDFAAIDAMNIKMITGVSTGGLQSILLMSVVDKSLDATTRTQALQQLIDSYSPQSESVLVDRNIQALAVITGSVAGTDPLRRHITDVLESRYGFPAESGLGTASTPLIDWLGRSTIRTFIGLVDADDGKFKTVEINDMVRTISDRGSANVASSVDVRRTARECVVTATMASSAMPGFHQQLRVDQSGADGSRALSTLFDGGVRRSVFFAEIGGMLRSAFASTFSEHGAASFIHEKRASGLAGTSKSTR